MNGDRKLTPPMCPALTNSELLEAWDAETERVAVEAMRPRPLTKFERWGWADIVNFAKEEWPC